MKWTNDERQQWVNRVALTVRRTLPVFLCEQTSAAPVGMSQRCHEPTSSVTVVVGLLSYRTISNVR
jgi:hypothetical protein